MPRPGPSVQRSIQRRPQSREVRESRFADGERLRRGLLTPRSVYRSHILRQLLAAHGHAVASGEVRRAVERRMAGRFTSADLSFLRRGQPRWVNSMQWERKKMVMEGLLETTGSAGYGIWRLTREGVREARAEVG